MKAPKPISLITPAKAENDLTLKKSLSLEQLNENLSKEVSELKNKIELLEEENKNHKNEIFKLNNKITNLDSKMNELLNWKNKIEGKEKEKEKEKKNK